MISPERLDVLQTQWVRFVGGLGVEPANAYPVFDRLVAAHSEPHRHYHTLEHVAEVLKVVGRLAKFADDPVAVQLASWFHDAVYDPKARDNESRSAEMARAALQEMGIDREAEWVADLIRATANHRSLDDADTDVLLDADLAILGAGEARYLRYAEAIRREYAFVPDDDYRKGRAAVLEKFLARDRIYRTDVMHLEAEAPARQNLRAEIERLK
ncbi:HD domain-containing protein [Limnoglobus roseus]|uniref:Uncharacterized protein n=1 Tax=Limnoglobus roseus TaxID=2598579 RepID=A0A5C1AQ10_9BACT|nr:HD domain-containing protein [Limnoglobus roseus]QEL20106.1 hypothetical protein PX52LOC_07194 [Limnoglobus roseus]